jgi:hypothetical protein
VQTSFPKLITGSDLICVVRNGKLLILSACLFGTGVIAVPFLNPHGFTAVLMLVAIAAWILSLVLLGWSTVRVLSPAMQRRLTKRQH